MIDLFIVGFVCISVAAFVGTKDEDENKHKQDVATEKTDETPT